MSVTETKEARRRSSLVARIAWTLVPPLLLVAITPFLTLPGVDRNVVESILMRQGAINSALMAESARNVSIFALGLMPIVTAYALVELVAILVPRLARLRHNNPIGRAKLDRAARVVALGFALVQGWSTAKSLASLSGASSGDVMPMVGILPQGIVTASLVGGVCLMLLVARFVTRQGLVNGIVFLMAIEELDDLRRGLRIEITKRLGGDDFSGAQALGLALVIIVPMVATWLALRPTRASPVPEDEPGGKPAAAGGSVAAPYRHARSLALHPEVPIPASSIAPYAVGASLIMLPVTIAPFFRGAELWYDRFFASDNATLKLAAIQLIATLIIGVIFARLLHRPREMADLVSRLGSGKRTNAEVDARTAIGRALPATVLFLTILVVASAAAGALRFGWFWTLALPLLVAVVMDAKTAIATHVAAPDLVSVWQERRASAVPVLCAVLETEGITVHTRGTRVLRLLQVFAPYTYAELLVSTDEAPRASAILRHLLVGEEAPKPAPADVSVALPPRADLARTLSEKDPSSISARGRMIGLALCGVAVLGTLVVASVPWPGPSAGPSAGPRPKLEVVRVDDDLDPFEDLRSYDAMRSLPPGVEIRIESAPVGKGRNERRSFATTKLEPGENVGGAVERMRPWLAKTITLPQGKRFAFEATENINPETGKSAIDGVRTFVLTGDVILTTDDVTEARANIADEDISVAVTLRAEAGDRFSDATDEWTGRRIAIVLDEMISSAPVVRTRIPGGRISISMGAGDREEMLGQAKKLATGLSGR